ncbi:relaxase/mobilization nuclease domain-containing protein [Myroides sp. 1354]|uniref:conjugal transfer protein MobB n=1 Tax=unclassified Myroides TaxID=2642485 RepID=UPI002577E60B|nr:MULTISPECIES: conjugal transfer protein MobB [unclassified Myroides]MDM1044371.1 relaxase/mobilization nuclease domain-containing protein [Myroides sp. R163-1]MDM1056246.1 relaxase/mobilization nuclease domain-containing protein [Myroides sp. 1354]MDM1069398.1 relaxase/mobilization nuclease domain-containing protein [Myroides sp. 1372]
MIVKIGKGSNLIGALSYNQLKVDKGQGSVLFTNNLPEPNITSNYIAQLYKHFEPYLLLNNKTEKVVRHISLNPNPNDKLSDDTLNEIAKQYMDSMGYKNQPYIIYKHSDIEREHIHIVTVCTDLEGKKIDDKYDHLKSMKTCREIEKKFNLTSSINQTKEESKQIQLKPVDYTKHNLKAQIASVIRYLPKYYKYDSLTSYNALLSLFNIRAERVEAIYNEQTKKGLVYFALNEKGEKVSNPFKASLFDKDAGYQSLKGCFSKSKEILRRSPNKVNLKQTIEVALNTTNSLQEFKGELLNHGINVVIFQNKDNRIYGVTFIDHNLKGVYKGSDLSKELSANTLNQKWSSTEDYPRSILILSQQANTNESDELHPMFEHLYSDTTNFNNDEFLSLFNLLNNNQEIDYEELSFEKRIKRRKKRSF